MSIGGGSLALNGSPYCPSSSSALITESTDSHLLPLRSSTSCRFNSIISCNNNTNSNSNATSSSSSSSNKHQHEYKIPKLEPFSRSKFERGVKDPPLIQQSEAQLADHCSTLEGETSYSCWQAYFELKELEKEITKEEVEKLIIEAGGVKSLIGCLHGVAAIRKANKEAAAAKQNHPDDDSKMRNGSSREETHHVPDGLPKTAQEMEEEDKARMPDSPLTRMLRMRGKHPAWYSPAPDHETD